MTDSGPIPTGALPKGWTPAGDDLTFEHPPDGLEVCADRRPEDAAETAGAPCAWKVRYERRVGEATERRTVGTVTTRDAAVDALLSCMRRVSGGPTAEPESGPDPNSRSNSDAGGAAASSESATVDGRWASLSTLADGVSLRDSVPATAEEGADAASYARSWAAKLDAE